MEHNFKDYYMKVNNYGKKKVNNWLLQLDEILMIIISYLMLDAEMALPIL